MLFVKVLLVKYDIMVSYPDMKSCVSYCSNINAKVEVFAPNRHALLTDQNLVIPAFKSKNMKFAEIHWMVLYYACFIETIISYLCSCA